LQMDVSTTASGIHENGIGQLSFGSPAASAASLELQGVHATIHVLLPGVASGASPSGTVVPTEGGAPGGWAEFPAPESAAGAGGGGSVGGAGGASP
ncbi:MAG TPA: hypothetical protein VNG33_21375, partial [Polyangiaceae bacterium]|nr:hypothetical protein [Polyangiaceae bacterium]